MCQTPHVAMSTEFDRIAGHELELVLSPNITLSNHYL